MTNREKFGEKVLDIMCDGGGLALKNGRPASCNGIRCADCELEKYNCSLTYFYDWLNAEYVEPTVDWSTVAVDTKILVRDCEHNEWRHRHFAGDVTQEGLVITWEFGKTSFTANSKTDIECWRYAKLAEDEV